MSYHSVIFDLDGILLDTLEDLTDLVNLVLWHNNLPGYELHKYKYFMAG